MVQSAIVPDTNWHGPYCLSDSICSYHTSYGDGSFSRGDLAVDTFSLGSTSGQPVTFPYFTFICGDFQPEESGIVGFGRGPTSLTSQLAHFIDGKFSYSLVSRFTTPDASSKMNFSSRAIVEGAGKVSTPLFNKPPPYSSFYYLTLEAITVDKTRLDFNDSSKERNIIIDSGTFLTMLPSDLYIKLAWAVTVKIEATPFINGDLSTGYNARDIETVPSITVNFKGVDVKLKPLNIFFPMYKHVPISEQVMCFAFTKTDGVSIYGNMSQMDFLVGYDTRAEMVSFKPTTKDITFVCRQYLATFI